jgi:hypothetical protein
MPPFSVQTGRKSLDEVSATAKLAKVIRSSSANEQFMSRFSPDSSPETDVTPRRQDGRNLDIKARVMKELPFRRSRSAEHRESDTGAGAEVQRSSIVEAAQAMVRDMPKDLIVVTKVNGNGRVLHSEGSGRKKREKGGREDWRNKPLPRIAHL